MLRHLQNIMDNRAANKSNNPASGIPVFFRKVSCSRGFPSLPSRGHAILFVSSTPSGKAIQQAFAFSCQPRISRIRHIRSMNLAGVSILPTTILFPRLSIEVISPPPFAAETLPRQPVLSPTARCQTQIPPAAERVAAGPAGT